MQTFESTDFQERQGFNGSVANITLSEVIQLQAQRQFTGLMRIYHGGLEGDLYFHGGDLLHAEVGHLTGVDAVSQLIAWDSGEFHFDEGIPAPARSIHMHVPALLLECHRRHDEALRDAPRAVPLEPLPSITRNLEATGSPMSALSQKIVNAVPGVKRAVLVQEDGTPMEDASPEAEALAARSVYLTAMLARPISATFGLGDLSVALLDCEADPLVVFRNKEKFLLVHAEDGAPLDRIETGIRRLFAPPKG